MFVSLLPAAVRDCVRGSIYCGLTIFFPVFRQAEQFCRWHFDEGNHLAALGDQRIIIRPHNAERAPKSQALQLIEPAFDYEPIAKFGGASIINFCADDHGIFFVFGHLREAEAELLGQKRAGRLDEAQISNIRHDASAIGIEEHHPHFRANARRSSGDHAQQ